MSLSPWYKRFAADLLSNPFVISMTDEQYAWYSKMLDLSWLATPQGYLPNDNHLIFGMIAKCSFEHFQECSSIVFARFQKTEDGNFLYHPKMVAQVKNMTQVSESKSHPGKSGRKKKQENEQSNGNQMISGEKSNDSDKDKDKDKEETCLPASAKKPSRKKRQPEADVEPPTWITRDRWDAYLSMRKHIGKEATAEAQRLTIVKLEKFRAEGHSPDDVLNQSIERSWTGIFRPSADYRNQHNSPPPKAPTNNSAADAELRRQFGDSGVKKPN